MFKKIILWSYIIQVYNFKYNNKIKYFMIQVYAFNGVPLKKSKKLHPIKYNVIYYTKEEVIKRNEINLLPKGIVINN